MASGFIAPQVVGTDQRGTSDYSVLKTYVPHTGISGNVCIDLNRVKYSDGTVECATCGRTGGWAASFAEVLFRPSVPAC